MSSLDRVYEAAESNRFALAGRARTQDGRGPAVLAGGVNNNVHPILQGNESQAKHEKQYLHNTGWVHSCVRVIAQRAAGQPVRIGRWKGKNGGSTYLADGRHVKDVVSKSMKSLATEIELIDHHPLLDAIDNPNPIMTRFMLMFITVASMELTGRAYWWIYRNDSSSPRPWTIFPLPSSWVTPIHKPGQLYAGWEINVGNGTEPVIVPGEDISHIYYPDPSNPLGASSPLQAQSKAVVTDESMSEAQRRSFTRGIWPGVAITVGRLPDAQGSPGFRPHLSDSQRAQIIGTIKNAYRGVVNFDEPIVLDGLIERIDKMSLNPREMDFLQSGKAVKARITQGFGTNPIVMGELEGANRASSYTADDIFCRQKINPLLDLMSQCMTAWVAPRFSSPSERLYVWVEPAQADDPEFQLEVEKSIKECMTLNEKRQKHGLPPIPGGDFILIPNNMVAYQVDRLSDVGAAEEPDPDPEPTPEEEDEGDE